MKNPNRFSVIKTILLLALLCLSTKSLAHDFEVNNFRYTVTSDSTVAVTGYWDNDYDYYIVIPSRVAYGNKVYMVSAIGDSAFQYFTEYSYKSTIRIPETVTSIGKDVFLGCDELFFVECLALEPPVLNDSFNGCRSVYLLVREESYDKYLSAYGNNIQTILCIDGAPTPLPSYDIYYYG